MRYDNPKYHDDPYTIYVDLGISKVDAKLDSNGAPLCGESSLAAHGDNIGTEYRPISFTQFLTYVKYRLESVGRKTSGDINRVFKFKGVYDHTFVYTDETWYTPIIRMFYSDERIINVTMTNWVDLEPYNIIINKKTDSYNAGGAGGVYNSELGIVFLSTANVNVTIENGNIQLEEYTIGSDPAKNISHIIFECISNGNDQLNNISLVNNRIVTYGGGVYSIPEGEDISSLSVLVSNYARTIVQGNLFVAMSIGAENALVFIDRKQSDYISYNITNNIFLDVSRIESVVTSDMRSFTSADVNNNVFTAESSTVLYPLDIDGRVRNLVLEDSNDHLVVDEFEFVRPSLGWADLANIPRVDYSYLSSDWIGISIHGNRRSRGHAYTAWGVRDGVGALYFDDMGDLVPSVSPGTPDIGDTITVSNIAPNYDVIYKPSSYDIGVDTPDGKSSSYTGVTYVIKMAGVHYIKLRATSYNGWYYVEDSVLLNIDSMNNLNVVVYNSDGVETDMFRVFDTVYLSATNYTSMPYPTSFTAGVDYGDDDTTSLIERGDLFGFTSYNSYRDSHIYNAVGDYIVKFYSLMTDGSRLFSYKPISIIDAVGDDYYVDLSPDYNSIYEYTYGIYDDFESGVISNKLLHDFRTNCVVEEYYNDHTAVGSGEYDMHDAIGYGSFSIELSMVRDNRHDEPSIIINTMSYSSGTPDGSISIEWDYTKSRLNVLYNKRKYKIPYDYNTLDLTCEESVRSLYIRISGDIFEDFEDNMASISYKTSIDSDWTVVVDDIPVGDFDYILVKSACSTHSGYGYIKIQHSELNDQSTIPVDIWGSEEFPFDYNKFYELLDVDSNTIRKNSNFLCRNSRVVTKAITTKPDTYFTIGAWNPKKYGPWMLTFNVFNSDNDFSGVTIKDGVIYNIKKPKSDLIISRAIDMYIVWNGDGVIRLRKNKWKYTGNDSRVDVRGCVLRSINGVLTEER